MRKFLLTLCGIFISVAPIQHLLSSKDLLEIKEVNKDFQSWIKDMIEDLNSHSRVADTAAGQIEYVKKGYGPTVLCLHGAPGGYDQSYLIGSKLRRNSFQVLAVSRPGYLRTPLNGHLSIEEQADAMVALLDTLKIDKVAVLGFSSGAPVGFQLALRHPDRVWGLVLESLGGQPSQSPLYGFLEGIQLSNPNVDLETWFIYLSAMYDKQATLRWALPLDNVLSGHDLQKRIQYVIDHRKQLSFFKHLFFSTMPVSVRLEGLINDLSNPDPWATLPYSLISTPTIIIESNADSNNRYAEAVNAAEKIPGAQLVTVEDSGHFIWLGKNTKEWEKQLIKFLRANSPKSKH